MTSSARGCTRLSASWRPRSASRPSTGTGRAGQVQVPVSTVTAVLAGLGVDATHPAGRGRGAGRAPAGTLAPGAAAVHGGAGRRAGAGLGARARTGRPRDRTCGSSRAACAATWRSWTSGSPPQDVDGVLVGEATFALPEDLPLGWHSLRAGTTWRRRPPLVVDPDPARAALPAAERLWGFLAQLYSVRSRAVVGGRRPARPGRPGRPGAGTSSAPASSWSTRCTRPRRCCRWSPRRTCRRRAASSARCTCGSRTCRRPALPRRRRAGRQLSKSAAALAPTDDPAERLDRDRVWVGQAARAGAAGPGAALAGPSRRARRRTAGARVPGSSTSPPGARWPRSAATPWRSWPAELHDPRSPGRRGRARRGWPTSSSCTCARSGGWTSSWPRPSGPLGDAGMAVGVVHDLAVGVHREGFDTWALRDVLAAGVVVGAPPDAFNQQGQDLVPAAVAAGRAGRGGLRAVPRHAAHRPAARRRHADRPRPRAVPAVVGARGGPAGRRGTYVRYDHEALVGILALEAHRAGACRGGRGPGHGRAVGARRACASGASSGPRCCGSSAASPASRCAPEHWRRAVPGHGDDARPAADRGLPAR